MKKNIDSLEYVAGLPAEKIVTAHGSYNSAKCLGCKKIYSFEWMQNKFNDAACKVLRCEICNGIVKPDIVFFGEMLPERFFKYAAADFPACDMLIIMGTSLIVQPFAGMANEVGKNVPRLLINLTEAGKKKVLHSVFGSPCLNYGAKNNYRDVFWKGTCDEGVRRLAELLGWDKELAELIKREWNLLDIKFSGAA
uniref:Deacetylase sirtuin-type domain-containing protein n=1 Tax=Syphacia muris TaxID=451379 RepID=A0A0N5AXD7_9BILA